MLKILLRASCLCAMAPVWAWGQQPSAPATSTTAVLQPATRPAAPLRIDLKLEGASAEEAFDALAKKAGVEIGTVGGRIWDSADPVFLDVKDGRFWPLCIELCRQARLSLADQSSNIRDRLVEITAAGTRDFTRLKLFAAGDFYLLPLYCQRNSAVSVDRPQAPTTNLNVYVRLLGDPGIGPFQVFGQPTITEATDENGLSLLQPGLRWTATPVPVGVPALSQMMPLNLACPHEAGKVIAHLKGQVRIVAAIRAENLVIASPLKSEPLQRELTECSLTIQPLKSLDSGAAQRSGPRKYSLRLSVRSRERGGALTKRIEAREIASLTQTMELADSEGRRYSIARSYVSGDEAANFEYIVEFSSLGGVRGAGEPAKLSWRLPLDIRGITLPIELSGIPIP